jgi:hypothetical protein
MNVQYYEIVGSSPDRVNLKTIKLVFVASLVLALLRRKSKDWLARNRNNVSQGSDMPIRGLLFQFSTIKIQPSSDAYHNYASSNLQLYLLYLLSWKYIFLSVSSLWSMLSYGPQADPTLVLQFVEV